ncbi:hypothetical protein HXX76_004037 [Chlamydomonas incerta]|uniref:Uncharacterized protein n=1 Tax=Chlamydomonas incerta TaxID=51695 RepID=A0A835TNR9_CHLIN|nr:hypothetical protein HXX76_004037 [Chlamydomonas incerta]|eukprot:KAG2441185.1 hypothetical protein HXX76_004037 [Chlamydomonas incerta]
MQRHDDGNTGSASPSSVGGNNTTQAAASSSKAAAAAHHGVPPSAPAADTGSASQQDWLSGPLGEVVLVMDGYSLSPVLAKIAADVVTGGRIVEADPSRLEVSRSCLAAAPAAGADFWGSLSLLQSGAAYAKTDEEAKERKEALAQGARMLGGDVDEVAMEAADREGPYRKFTFM